MPGSIHYTENASNSPFGLANTNPPGSPYAAAFSRSTDPILRLPVDPKIFNAQPQFHLDLQHLMAFASSPDHPSDEVYWFEQVFSRNPIQVRTTFAGVAATPGSTVTGTIEVVDSSIPHIFVRQKINYRGSNGVNTQAIVTAINTTPGAASITVTSMVGRPLSPIEEGRIITNGLTVGNDGGNAFSSPSRIQLVKRSNVLEKIGPEHKYWAEIEMKKYKNLQQVDYIKRDMLDLLDQMKISLSQRIWFGEYGEGISPEGVPVKFTEGIVPAIINNGGPQIPSTMTDLFDDLIDAVHGTNFMSSTNHRYVYATPQLLSALNMKQKAEFVRYSWDTRIWDMDFEEWRVGGQRLTLVPVQAWSNPGFFPPEFAGRVVVTQAENIRICGMRGIPMLRQYVTQSRTNITPADIHAFERYCVEGFVGTMVMNAAANFIIDVDI